MNSKELMAKDILPIRQMPMQNQEYLYGLCDKWAKEHFDPNFQIIAVMLKHVHSLGLVHCFLYNVSTQKYIDVRGEYDSIYDILIYTGVNVFTDELEVYSFSSVEEFDCFIAWLEFEIGLPQSHWL